jgi:hypothetical protein
MSPGFYEYFVRDDRARDRAALVGMVVSVAVGVALRLLGVTPVGAGLAVVIVAIITQIYFAVKYVRVPHREILTHERRPLLRLVAVSAATWMVDALIGDEALAVSYAARAAATVKIGGALSVPMLFLTRTAVASKLSKQDNAVSLRNAYGRLTAAQVFEELRSKNPPRVKNAQQAPGRRGLWVSGLTIVVRPPERVFEMPAGTSAIVDQCFFRGEGQFPILLPIFANIDSGASFFVKQCIVQGCLQDISRGAWFDTHFIQCSLIVSSSDLILVDVLIQDCEMIFTSTELQLQFSAMFGNGNVRDLNVCTHDLQFIKPKN